MGWLTTIASAGAALAVTGLGYAARKDQEEIQQNLSKTKLQFQTNLTKVLADPANQTLSADDIKTKALDGIDPSEYQSEGKQEFNNFMNDATATIQQKVNERQIQVQKVNKVNNSVDLMNQTRNHVSAGVMGVSDAEDMYEKSIAPTLRQNTTPEQFNKVDRQYKSSIRLDYVKTLDANDANKLLKTDDYMNGMTASDYQIANQYVKTKHASAITQTTTTINLQHTIAKDVLSGNYTPNEINVMLQQHQDVNSDALMSTAHTYQAIKNMTVPELSEILKPPSNQKDPNGQPLPVDKIRSWTSSDDTFRQLVIARRDAVMKKSQQNVVEFAGTNGELTPVADLGASPVALKASLSKRIVDVSTVQKKYGAKAKTLFTTQEANVYKQQFNEAPNKASVLNTFGQALPEGQYAQADSVLYNGAGADIYSIQHGSINFANESYKGYILKQNKEYAGFSETQKANIKNEITKVYPSTDNKTINSLMDQVTNVAAARGVKPADLKPSDVDKLIQESTGSIMYPQKTTLGIFNKHAFMLAPDKNRADILGSIGKTAGKWAQNNEATLFNKITGGSDITDLHIASGDKVDVRHLRSHTVLKNITPTTYKMVYTDGAGQTSALYDKSGKPIIIDAHKIDQSDIDTFASTYDTVGGAAVSRLGANNTDQSQATLANELSNYNDEQGDIIGRTEDKIRAKIRSGSIKAARELEAKLKEIL